MPVVFGRSIGVPLRPGLQQNTHEIIPFAMGEALYVAAPAPKAFLDFACYWSRYGEWPELAKSRP